MAREGKLFSNTLLLGVSAAAGKALSFLLLPFFTAELSPAEFGVCEILISTALLFSALFSVHAPQATFRFLAQGEDAAVGAGAHLLLAGVIFFSVSMPLWGQISVLQPYRALLWIFVVASLLRSFASHILRAKGQFLLFSLQQLFCALLTALLQILFLRTWHLGVRGYLWGIVLGDTITFLTLLFPLWTRWQRVPRVLYGRMLRFALPFIPAAVLWWGMSGAERYILLYFHGERATGLYAAAGRFPTLITFAASVFLEAWHYASLQAPKETREVLFGRIYALVVPALLALGGIVTAASPVLVTVFLSHAYADAVRMLGFLFFGAICAGMSSFLDSIYSLQLRSCASLYTTALAATGRIGLSFLLVPPLGAVGAAAAGALGFLGLFLLRAWHTARFLKFPRYAKRVTASLLLLLAASVFFSLDLLLFGVGAALLSLWPIRRQLLTSFRFLFKRFGMFLSRGGKKEKYIEKEHQM